MPGRKRIIFFSGLVLVGQITQGLLLHPYQTMQSLVREKVFAWLSLMPAGLFVLSWLFYQLVQFVVVTVDSSFLSFCFDWWLIFLLYWQLLLIYLLFRFAWAFWRD